MYKINEQNEIPIFYADEPEPKYGVPQKLNESPEIRYSEDNDDQNSLTEVLSDEEYSEGNEDDSAIGFIEEPKSINKNTKDKKTKKKHTLCKLVKKDYVKEHFPDYQALVADPEYICKKCGRAAKDDASLCKPLPITKLYEGIQNS